MTFTVFAQVVASKYMNDEGEMEALTNSDWAKLGMGNSLYFDQINNFAYPSCHL